MRQVNGRRRRRWSETCLKSHRWLTSALLALQALLSLLVLLLPLMQLLPLVLLLSALLLLLLLLLSRQERLATRGGGTRPRVRWRQRPGQIRIVHHRAASRRAPEQRSDRRITQNLLVAKPSQPPALACPQLRPARTALSSGRAADRQRTLDALRLH
jgi:hypothetical protein